MRDFVKLGAAFSCALAMSSWAAVATAEPVLSPGGKPGVAESWTANGEVVTLVIGADHDAEAVAKAILEQLEGVSAKTEKNRIVLTGMKKDALVAALTKVDIAGADDVDEMLAAMQKPGGDEDSGSSIRATKAVDFSDVVGAKHQQVTAKVLEVERARYPYVTIKVRIVKVPRKFRDFKAGHVLSVVPKIRTKDGSVDQEDRATMLNIGAWYVQPGDRVVMRMDEKRSELWIAEAFKRLQ